MNRKAEELLAKGYQHCMDTQDPNFFQGMLSRTIGSSVPANSFASSPILKKKRSLKRSNSKKIKSTKPAKASKKIAKVHIAKQALIKYVAKKRIAKKVHKSIIVCVKAEP